MNPVVGVFFDVLFMKLILPVPDLVRIVEIAGI